jgi:glycosyltransferase involved in cell wall biosynthesis
MRLLFVIDNLSTGGAQRQMINLAVGLRERGHEVFFFCYYPQDILAGKLHEANIPIHLSLKRSRFSTSVIRQLAQHIKALNVDLVLAYQPTPNVYTLLASIGIRPRPKIVISERLSDPVGRLPEVNTIFRFLYRLADFTVVNSHHQRLTLTQRYPWLEGKITTIYNGVDLQQFVPSNEPLPVEPFRLLSISSVAERKNGLCLVRALAILRDQYGLNPCVDWVGQHVTFDKDRNKYIRLMNQEIVDLRLSEQWQWLYQRTDVVSLFHQHHALVHPSYLEGLPNVVCEGLACGCPIIVSNTLDHPNLVQDGVSGYLFDWRDPADLARVIKRLYDLSPEERRTMGRQGRSFAEQNLSLDRLTDEYEKLFEQLLVRNRVQ